MQDTPKVVNRCAGATFLGACFGLFFGAALTLLAFAMGGIQYKPLVRETAVPIVTPAEVRFKLQNGETWVCTTDEAWDCTKEEPGGETLEP